MKTRLAVVEDDDQIRDMVTNIIEDITQFDLCGAYADAETFLENYSSLHLDVAILDIGLPKKSGIDIVKELKKQGSNTHCIMFTVFDTSPFIFEALAAGARGYLLKNSSRKDIEESITSIMAGGSPMSASVARMVVDSFYKKNTNTDLLSKKESEVLQALKKGYSYKEIADDHYISIHTVRTHIRSIYEKLEVHTRTEAINKVWGDNNIGN
jgi:DNA-binding NarL/FixJ family response regulator